MNIGTTVGVCIGSYIGIIIGIRKGLCRDETGIYGDHIGIVVGIRAPTLPFIRWALFKFSRSALR